MNIKVNSINKIVMSAGWVAISDPYKIEHLFCFIFRILQFYPKIFVIDIFNIVCILEWYQSRICSRYKLQLYLALVTIAGE